MCTDFLVYSNEFDNDYVSIISKHFEVFGDLAYDNGFQLTLKYECNRCTSVYLSSLQDDCDLKETIRKIDCLIMRKWEQDDEGKELNLPRKKIVPYVRMLVEHSREAEIEAEKTRKMLEEMQNNLKTMMNETRELKAFAHQETVKHDIINIILIGHEGCGKTMFLNSLPSLLKHSSFDDVISGKLEILEDTSITYTDENSQSHRFQFKSTNSRKPESSKDVINIDESSYYLFMVNDVRYRIVNTPGIKCSDNEGIVEEILKSFNKLEKIQAILLFSSEQMEKSLNALEYVLEHIIPQTNQSWENNIIFAFNLNSKDSLVTSVLPRFSKVLENSKVLNTTLHSNNIFYSTNTWMLNAVAEKNKIKLPTATHDLYRDQFAHSKKKLFRLLTRISQLHPIDMDNGRIIRESGGYLSSDKCNIM